MRAVVQRVSRAELFIDGRSRAHIGKGLVVLLGVARGDAHDDADWLAGKIVRLRIFPDQAGLMNLGLLDVAGQVLVVSQFTLFADTKKGNRPAFVRSAPPDEAVPLYDRFLESLGTLAPGAVQSGVFGADMQIALTNDGPVTIVFDTRQRDL